MSDISRIEKKTDAVLDKINRAHLIATLSVLQSQNQIKKSKEELQMKKFNIGSKLSNRTKIIMGITLVTGIGAVISAVKDSRDIADIEFIDVTEELGERVVERLEEATSAIAEEVE